MHTNQKLLVDELKRRGAKVRDADPEIELIEVIYEGRKEFLLDRFSSLSPYNLVKMTADKYLTKNLLRKNGISAPEGEVFSAHSFKEAVEYAQKIGFPVVVKPNWGSHGDSVFVEIKNERELVSAVNHLEEETGVNTLFLVEKHLPGKEYRVFITIEGKYAVLNRDPAHVIGDGKHNISELGEIESKKRDDRKKRYLCPIVFDRQVDNFLKESGKDLRYIPKKDEKIYLRKTSNLAKGGVSEDVTDEVHSSVIDIAQKVLDVFQGLPFIGLDIMTENIDEPQTKSSYGIVEVNSNPGLSMHMMPGKGKSRNVASYLADVMFPGLIKK
ncbi:MAG: ATP-grasp domain-containing protein [bacterium]|nr:ATP-grasp domain-containing protein [bacterium]